MNSEDGFWPYTTYSQVEQLLGRPLPELLRQRMTEMGAQASELLQ